MSDYFTICKIVQHPKKKHTTTLERVTVTGKEVRALTRKAARHWCRNNYHRIDHEGFVIVHPDGTKEPFVYQGIL